MHKMVQAPRHASTLAHKHERVQAQRRASSSARYHTGAQARWHASTKVHQLIHALKCNGTCATNICTNDKTQRGRGLANITYIGTKWCKHQALQACVAPLFHIPPRKSETNVNCPPREEIRDISGLGREIRPRGPLTARDFGVRARNRPLVPFPTSLQLSRILHFLCMLYSDERI